MARKERRRAAGRELKVGLVVGAAIAVLAVAVFLIGKDDRLFGRKARYFIHFENVSGLAAGNPVQLNGVNVGTVQDVVLPEDMGEDQITVWIAVSRRYAERIRGDSAARIKTLGLLGDKYIALNSGSPEFPQIQPGSEIPTAQQTNVDQLIASGEDVMQNVVGISHSLSRVLAAHGPRRGAARQADRRFAGVRENARLALLDAGLDPALHPAGGGGPRAAGQADQRPQARERLRDRRGAAQHHARQARDRPAALSPRCSTTRPRGPSSTRRSTACRPRPRA